MLAALVLACGDSGPPQVPAPAVDLIAQADAASEIVDPELLLRHSSRLLKSDAEAYLGEELRRIGIVPIGPGGSWQQPFEKQRRLGRVSAPWVLQQGERRVVLAGGRDVVAALGGKWGGVRLRGTPLVFVAPTLAVPAGTLDGKVLVVLSPPASQAGATSGSPLPDLFRRAVATGAYGVLVLPRAGWGASLPTATAASLLTEGSGLPIAGWLNEEAARGLALALAGVTLEGLARLEWRQDLLPLSLGTMHGEVGGRIDREPHHNVVGVVPARQGGFDETVALVASLPAGATDDAVTPDDRRSRAAAAAELLAVATGFQALSDPPRRTVVVAFTDPGEDGLAGARRLAADSRWGGPRLAAAVVLAGGNLAGPTEDVALVGDQASPVRGLAARVAARQARRLATDLEPGLFWTSPARALIRAGVPTAMLEPGRVPQPVPAGAMATVRATASGEARSAGGMVQDARFAFRLALELAEGGRLPRVDAARVEAALRVPLPPPPPAVPPRPLRPVGPPLSSAALPAGASGSAGSQVGAAAPSPTDAAGAAGNTPPELARAPGFVAPPPADPPPAALAPQPEPPATPAAATPTPTPPQR